MAGWGGLGGYIDDLGDRRNRAGDPSDTSPGANLTRRACDWAARKGGVVAGAPHVQYACGPYWDGQPDYVPPEPTTSEPPFEGGQCAVNYRITLTWEEGQNVGTKVFSSLGGPIGAPNTIFEQDEGGGFEQYRTEFEYQVNATVRATATHRFDTTGGGLLDFVVDRVDGLPDDCGSLPAEPVYPDPRVVPPTVLPPDGSPVPISDPNDPNDTTPPVTFPPTDTPYDPWVPIIEPPPGFPPFVFPPSSGDDIPPREGPETELPPGGTDGGDIPEPEPVVPSEVCIGYAFDFYAIPANRGGIPDSTPARYYEIFGSAQLKIETDLGEFYDLPVKIDSRRGVCYRSDESLKVTGLSLNSKTSFGPVRVKPIFVLREDKS